MCIAGRPVEGRPDLRLFTQVQNPEPLDKMDATAFAEDFQLFTAERERGKPKKTAYARH